MFNNVALDVVIGLVFVFLLYSLLLTIIQELIANKLSFRAKFLEKAIVRMLDDEKKDGEGSLTKALVFLKTKLGLRINPTPADPNRFSGLFYSHPLIKYLGERPGKSKPSYLVSETFSKVIVDILRGNDVQPGQDMRINIQSTLDNKKIAFVTKETLDKEVRICDETHFFLKSIWADAQGDVERFRTLLENWFNETMDRTTDWYKKYAQKISLAIGLIIAIIFNVNAIAIAHKLQKDPKLREQIVQQADAFLKTHPNLDKELKQEKEQMLDSAAKEPDTTKKKAFITATNNALELEYQQKRKTGDSLQQEASNLVRNDLKATNEVLGIGIRSFTFPPCKDCGALDQFLNGLKTIFVALIGWLITALALSLGAPFWFDLLNKLMRLRSSVAPSADDAKQKDVTPVLPTIKRVG